LEGDIVILTFTGNPSDFRSARAAVARSKLPGRIASCTDASCPSMETCM